MFEFIKRLLGYSSDLPSAKLRPVPPIPVAASAHNLRRDREPDSSPNHGAAAQYEVLAEHGESKPELPQDGVALMVGRGAQARAAARARKLNFDGLRYVRLPKAPTTWDEPTAPGIAKSPDNHESGDQSPVSPKKGAIRFRVAVGTWVLSGEEKLVPEKRPNAAYRDAFHRSGSTLWLDTRGHRGEFPNASAIALVVGRGGEHIAERPLASSCYRSAVNGDGSGMVFLSQDGTVHGYTATLEPTIVEQLSKLPEYAEQAKRFGISPESLKSHVRCIGISRDQSRWLVTIVDEAWCYDAATRQPVWGLRFPSKEGWTEVISKRSQRTGASVEVMAALRLMELDLPVSPEKITHQYRALAMRWHPDRNPKAPTATLRFQELGAAMELLTGIDLSQLSAREVECITYGKVLCRDKIVVAPGVAVTITMSTQISGAFGRDWIYAADFARAGCDTLLGGYSGLIVETDSSGLPARVYDIGGVPRQVAKTSSHVFILAYSRLYVLQQDQLVGMVDLSARDDLIIGESGFGVLRGKQFQWFSLAGKLIGQVNTKDPIRRVYYSERGLVVETRTHRALFTGADDWWRVAHSSPSLA